MTTSQLQTLALITFVISHGLLLFIFLFDAQYPEITGVLFYVLWGVGIVSAVTQIFFANRMRLSKWVLILLGISSIVWLIPIFLMTYFGFPMLAVFLAIGIYAHRRYFLQKNQQ